MAIEVCGWVYGWVWGGRPVEQALAAAQLDAGTWERALRGWQDRIRADTMGSLKALFSEGYHAGSGGEPLRAAP